MRVRVRVGVRVRVKVRVRVRVWVKTSSRNSIDVLSLFFPRLSVYLDPVT